MSEEERAAFVDALRAAYEACYTEYMDCPWCSGHIGRGNDWHDDTCKYFKAIGIERPIV